MCISQDVSSIWPGLEYVFLIFQTACTGYGYWTDNSTVACYDTYNATSPIFTDTSVDNSIDRQWQWFLCNEPFFYWQE